MDHSKANFLPASWPPRAISRLGLGYVPEAGNAVVTLSAEQREAARTLATEARTRLDGPSGSGKTHVAATVALKFAMTKRRVLYLCPRGPLAAWLRWNLEGMGVEVKTLHSCATAALAGGRSPGPARKLFDDPVFFNAAREAVEPDAYDLVIGDEWQTTTSAEQGFVKALVGDAQFIEVTDSSRDMRFLPPREVDYRHEVRLTEVYRLWGRLMNPTSATAATANGSGTPGSFDDLVRTSHIDGPEELPNALWSALKDFEARGFAPGEIGVVSCLGRAASPGLELLKQGGPVPADSLFEAGKSDAVACDGFSYWLGLEQRAVVVIEAPLDLTMRSIRLRTALGRAREALHLIMRPPELLGQRDLFEL